jgi:phage baseplate assembly protein V
MSERLIARMLAPLARAIGSMMARGTVVLATATSKMQTLQIKLLSGEVQDDVEHIEPYGFTAHPHAGAEHVTLFFGGNRSHGVTIMVADRRYRLQGLAEGEVALSDDLGQKIHLTRNGIVIDGAGLTMTIQNIDDLNVTAAGAVNVTAGGKATVTADIIELNGGGAVKGVVQKDCICAFTGFPHPQASATVKASA